MAAAARKGCFELNILVWDLVDMLGYEPTVSMYENTLQGFVMGVRQDHNVFAVLGEMEERGFSPSRALIRSLSLSIRYVLACHILDIDVETFLIVEFYLSSL